MTVKTLITEQNAKTTKGEKFGYLTGILYMAPHSIVKGINMCPWATESCKKACLYSAGRGKFSNVQAARVRKTELFRDDKDAFFNVLIKDITRLEKKAEKKGLKLAIRLNGTSDIPWENYKIEGFTIFDIFPKVQFYDYTKAIHRANKALPKNYHLTLSYTGENDKNIFDIAKRESKNIAIVFSGKELPKKYKGLKVLNGDDHDLRFIDSTNSIIGLLAKGDAKKMQNSKFVVNV